MTRCILAVALAVGVASGCGDSEPSRTAKPPPPALAAGGPPGKLVGIGGGRSLFVHCAGSGSPAVVLEAGGETNTTQWADVQPELARTTRVCAYDRAGVGSSVAPPGIRDALDEIADLRQLLAHTQIDPPYVLVGQSYGGVRARVFAVEHAAETAGLVLVDTMGRDGRRRQLDIWPASQAPEVRSLLATTVVGNVDLAAGEAIASRLRSLGDTPLAVIDAARHRTLDPAPPRLRRALKRLWARMHGELARLSDDSVHVTALRSDHDVPSSRVGQPGVVIDAVQAVVRAARDHTRLPPCEQIFSGPDVRCRQVAGR